MLTFSLVAAVLLSTIAGVAAVQDSDSPATGARVMVEVQGLHYDAGKPVLVRVTARNNGEAEVANPLADPIASGFRLTGPDGKTYEPQAAGSSAPQVQPRRLAGQSYFGQVVDLTPHFPALANTGTYSLTYGDSNAVEVNIIPAFNSQADYKAVIKTSAGDLTMQLYHQDAPLTVRNFVDLARQGFYDGLTFHYVRAGDIIMGGDPQGDGTGSSGFFVPAEFNDRQHLAGTVAMVRGSDPNSASSQFYICLKPQPERDGQFSVFGQIVDGMDALGKLAAVETSGTTEKPFFKPLEPVVMESVTIIESSQEGS